MTDPLRINNILIEQFCRDLAAGDMRCPRTKAMGAQLFSTKGAPDKTPAGK